MSKEKPKTKDIKKDKVTLPENISRGEKSINLIPKLTKAEANVESKKLFLNTTAAILILVFILVTIGIIGFNIFTKLQLNSVKKNLYSAESIVNQKSTVLASNEEILRRIALYKKVEASTYSSRDVVLYWQTISSGVATIESIELSSGLNFTVTGRANNLTDVSKLWYLLGNDTKIDTVNLKSVAKDLGSARFTFEGKLNIEEFN